MAAWWCLAVPRSFGLCAPFTSRLPVLCVCAQEALRWAEQATEIRAYAADALALQAGLHLEKRDYHHAKQVGSKSGGLV